MWSNKNPEHKISFLAQIVRQPWRLTNCYVLGRLTCVVTMLLWEESF